MRALITGITGQDGSYLAEFLLNKGYEVFGLVRPNEPDKPRFGPEIGQRIKFVEGDLLDQPSLNQAVQQVQPQELYNLAAQTFVPASWEKQVLTADITALGVLRLLEAVRVLSPQTRFLQVSSSEMFGAVKETPQTEQTCFRPRSPYGVAKVFGHQITGTHRTQYGMFACSAICYNHESPRRGPEFVTRKVSQAAARCKLGRADKLKMGSLDAHRDWGFAGDYVEAMWLMLQQEKPEDFVLATGQTHTVQELVETAFACVGLDWKKYVEVDPALVRGPEVYRLCGDPSKAEKLLGWKPKVTFKQLVTMMVESDLAALQRSD
jgi:GDPmannose 4,6-dehydratase